ncbi:MAG: M61 family metallopeptidase [Candidatus Velthaea sp.]
MRAATLMLGALAAGLLLAPEAAFAGTSEVLSVDATDAPRQVWHAHLRIPVVASDVVLAYPKWIPGNHGPTGPIANLASLRAHSNGTPIAWTRDAGDVYAFHFLVPRGGNELELDYDLFEGSPDNGNLTAQLAVLDWNQVVLYPRAAGIRDVSVQADITLPAGWTEATALPLATPAAPFGTQAGHVSFAPVTLERLVDSPLYCGAHERVVPLANAHGMTSEVDLFGDATADVQPSATQIGHWKALVAEADALYGYRHWEHYHFLLTLSDSESGRGLEHHESSANGMSERYLTDPDLYASGGDLLPHEYTHSWNGKYRRPAGLLRANYQEPMVDDDLWMYEGMTQYWGHVLAARSGLTSGERTLETWATSYAQLDIEPGRLARPLLDTARAQGLTRAAQSRSGRYQRRGEDYYAEGALIWLDADTLIRERTHGKKSLDDFARLFFGNGKATAPTVLAYTRADIIAALTAVYRFDWALFLKTRVDDVAVHPPLGGITRGGWRLVYTPGRSAVQARTEDLNKTIDATYSLGSSIENDGTLPFTIETLPLARAGISAGSKILAVNDQKYSAARLRLALRTAQHSSDPIRLIVDDMGAISTFTVDYHGGERYPHLVRDRSRTDWLSAIAASKTSGPVKAAH